MIKPPAFAVIAAFIMTAYCSYLFYQIWFKPKEFLKSSRKGIYKLPRWYPFRSYYMARVNHDKSWIFEHKITSIIAEVFIIVILALVLTAWVIGK